MKVSATRYPLLDAIFIGFCLVFRNTQIDKTTYHAACDGPCCGPG